MKKYSIIVLFLFLFSCEDIITPDLPTNEPIVVVDAWINNLEKDQVIKLSESQNYLDSSSPVPVVGASVFIYDEFQNQFNFTEVNNGEYVWSPDSIIKNLGDVGTKFYLSISLPDDGINIFSESQLNRTSIIDSVNFVRGQVPEGSYYAEFWSREQEGPGDAYWIKSYINVSSVHGMGNTLDDEEIEKIELYNREW